MAEIEEKKQISYGKLISKENYMQTKFIPSEVKGSLKDAPYYLLIYIPGDKMLKISVFAVQNQTIKKILIRLQEFSPELVKGISDVLKDFQLGESTIHTTGLCFSGINCFYETYLDTTLLQNRKISLEAIQEKFKEVPRVMDVQLVDINVSEL